MKSGKMKLLIILFLFGILLPTKGAVAQIPIAEIIKAAIVKVIKAVDLKIQRLQNETIRLQNAQKAIENTLSKLKLDEISDWVEKQRKLYADYYEELWKVKTAITYYRNVSDILKSQKDLVKEYKLAYSLFKGDKHFTTSEVKFMEQVYEGILQESIKNIDQIMLVINSFKTQMSDGSRLQIIQQAADNIETNLSDLRRFNNSNVLVSLQRAKDQFEVDAVKVFYGIE